ncbi:MAG TPA: hypothetical protein VJA22_01815 [Patescibacteria group bacterium]|nr:hypothetical protein [Patescibacteria group bacterium]
MKCEISSRDSGEESQQMRLSTGDEQPESFLAEWNCAKNLKVRDAFSALGFRVIRQIPDVENQTVTYEGEAVDRSGNTFSLTIKKGEMYKSPKEFHDENLRRSVFNRCT